MSLRPGRFGEPAPDELEGDTKTHDPGLIREDSTYYVFSTGDSRGLNGGAIQIRRSGDLRHWEVVGTVFERRPRWIGDELGGRPPNLWAPEIARFNDQFYLYYACSRFGSNHSVIGLATNRTLDPASPDYVWVDQGMVIRSSSANNWNAIDPSLCFDAEGVPWLALGSFWGGIKMRRLDPATGMLAADDTELYSLASRAGGPVEAPALVYRAGFFYLFVSFDFCCRGVRSTYNIRVGRARQITGPYVDRDGKPMDKGGGSLVIGGDDRFAGRGGQSVYVDGDIYHLVCHAYDRLNDGAPRLQIHDLDWTSDGWPTVGRL